MGRESGSFEQDTDSITKEFEAPKFINRRSGAVRNALRTEPETPPKRLTGSPRPDVGKVDGRGWASREKARRAFETIQKVVGHLDASAARAGVVSGSKLRANGSVSILVQRPGPDTSVRTSASGELFKNVTLQRNRKWLQMAGDEEPKPPHHHCGMRLIDPTFSGERSASRLPW
jgi:hypothetical protein